MLPYGTADRFEPGPGTMYDKKNDINYQEYDLADTILGKPHDFLVGEQRFCIWPVTLGKIFMLRPYMESLGTDRFTGPDPCASALQLVREKRELCATILAIHTLDNCRQSVLDIPEIKERTAFFSDEVGDEDLASLLVIILTSDRTRQVIDHLGLDKERERLEEALRVKRERNVLSFGGRSIFGGFIAPLMEMGFSADEIIYELGYGFLRLMLMDKQVSLYMSDEEIQQMCGSAGALIDGDGADADSQLESFFASKGVIVE